jgi:hypothetical protein
MKTKNNYIFILLLTLFTNVYSQKEYNGFTGIYSFVTADKQEFFVHSIKYGFINGITTVNYTSNGYIKYHFNYTFGFLNGPIAEFNEKNELISIKYYLMGLEINKSKFEDILDTYDNQYEIWSFGKNEFHYELIGLVSGTRTIRKKGTDITIVSEYNNGFANGQFKLLSNDKLIGYGKVTSGKIIEFISIDE